MAVGAASTHHWSTAQLPHLLPAVVLFLHADGRAMLHSDLPESIHQLDLVFCNLTGPLPQQLPAALRRLDLSDNQLTGDISKLDASALEVRQCRLQQLKIVNVVAAQNQ